MAEGDDDKEADVSKASPSKRPLGHGSLKIVIRRSRPNGEVPKASAPLVVEPATPKPVVPKVRPRTPPADPPVPCEPPVKKPKVGSVLPLILLSKYADIAELMTAFEIEKPKGLQEVWHSVRQRQQEEECDHEENDVHSKYYASGVCDFGEDCEMPWLHPVINFASWENDSGQECIVKEEVELPSKCSSAEVSNSKDATRKTCAKDQKSNTGVHFEDWRYGAAKLWFDRMEVPDDCEDFNYGFKLNDELQECKEEKKVFPDDAFLMVSQLHWEDDVIWNGTEIKPEIVDKMKLKWKSVGGRISDRFSSQNYQNRFSGHIQMQRIRDNYNRQMLLKYPYSMHGPMYRETEEEELWKSVFKFENEDLITGTWEKEIIWDPESMSTLPCPSIPTLDPSDDNIVIGVPSDETTLAHFELSQNQNCIKLPHPHMKHKKVLIDKTGIKLIKEVDEKHFSLEDPFNVSNDGYYAVKSSETSLRLKPVGRLIQHSIPVLELRPPFIPTHLNIFKLQNFHRIPLKRYSHGVMSRPVAHAVHSLTREINLKAMLREDEIKASGGGEVFFMREAEDLSGRDGEIVLVEFSEEHPLLMNEVGMCSKIINYYKRTASKDHGPPELKYGEVVYPHTSPFLGVLSPGQCIQAVENNLYRCPIYQHQIRESDFLVIRTRNSLSIREIDALYLAGQQCPLYEVPAPHSRPATNFTRDFLQVHIFRMFHNCPDRPQWVRMDEIKRAFPDINDLNIRKILKLCSDFKRVDALDSSCWVLRSDFRLPTEEELRSIVTPEQCCAQFSMLAAEQRLKDAGYGGNVLFVPPDEEDEDDENGMQLKIDDEVKAAPWNLTRGFIESVNGKRLLELTGLADPTGCGEGFSYLTRAKQPGRKPAVENTSPQVKEFEKEKPSVANAKILLRKMGVPERDIKTLSAWELMEFARKFTKKKMRGRGKSAPRIPKAKPMTTAEHFTKYKEECQRIFDIQNQRLQSVEDLSTDEDEESDEDGSDVEQMGKILENLITNGRSYSDVCKENEEKEREELVKMMMDENGQKQSSSKEKPKKTDRKDLEPQPDRVLKINRTFRDSSGREYTRVEFVRKSSVIDIYLKIRATKDEAFISQFSALERAEKQKMMREKRNLEGQLLRLQQRENMLGSKSDSKPLPSEIKSTAKHESIDPKRRCGACGNPGHKKGNKVCPQYCGPVAVAMTEEEEEEYQRQLNVDDQNLVNVDGTKLKLSVKLIKRAEEMKKKTLVLRVPKDIVRKRKRPVVETHCDYLEKYQRPVNRRRVDPQIVLSNAFEAIVNEMRDLPDSDPFHFPVNAKTIPHYYTIITRPMDLQTVRENIRQKKYQSRKDFLEDVHQIVQNSTTFNGPQSPFTINAGKMLDLCVRRMGEQEEELIRLEETITEEEKERANAPRISRGTRMPRKPVRKLASGFVKTQVQQVQVEETQIVETIPKSIVDLDISDSEEEAELEAGYLDGRACPVVP